MTKPNVHPKVVATGVAGAAAIIIAQVGDLIGFHPESPAFYTAVGALIAFAAGYLRKG